MVFRTSGLCHLQVPHLLTLSCFTGVGALEGSCADDFILVSRAG